MSEVLDLFGGSLPGGPPAVPPVTFAGRRLTVRGYDSVKTLVGCGHCQINASNWRRDPALVPQWATESDVTTLTAVRVVTQPDGSTLNLCVQHAEEHLRRGTTHG